MYVFNVFLILVPFRHTEFGSDAFGQFLHVLVHFLMGQTGIDLRGAHVLMSHHLAYGFQRNPLRKSDKGPEIMPCHMVGKPTLYATKLGQFRHVVGQSGTAGHIEKSIAFPFTLVFFHDAPWNIKEKYITLAFCLLTFEPYPKISLAVRVQIGNIQTTHIRICDASERAKDKQVADGKAKQI